MTVARSMEINTVVMVCCNEDVNARESRKYCEYESV